MSKINPIEIKGLWDKGYSIDKHSNGSTYIGEDPFGHPRFDTDRTVIGQYMYELKYLGKVNRIKKIVDLIVPFLDSWDELKEIDVVLPVPSSNTNRMFQPVPGIASEIAAYLKKAYIDNILIKTSDLQLKNIDSEEKTKIDHTIIASKKAKRKYSALIVDDIYDTGKTLNDAVSALRTDSNLVNVYVLTMTKKR